MMKLNVLVRRSPDTSSLQSTTADDKEPNGVAVEDKLIDAINGGQEKDLSRGVEKDGQREKDANENIHDDVTRRVDVGKTWHVTKAAGTSVLSEANNNVIHEKDTEGSIIMPFGEQYKVPDYNEQSPEISEESPFVPFARGEPILAKSPYSLLPFKTAANHSAKCHVPRRTPPPLIKDHPAAISPLQIITPVYEPPVQPPMGHIPSNLLFSERAATLTHMDNDDNNSPSSMSSKDSSASRFRDKNVIVIVPEEPGPDTRRCQDEPMDLSRSAPEPSPKAPETNGVLDLSNTRADDSLTVTERLLLSTNFQHHSKSLPTKPRKSRKNNAPTQSHNAPKSNQSSRSSTPNKPAGVGEASDPNNPASIWSPLWNPYMAAYSHYMNMAMLGKPGSGPGAIPAGNPFGNLSFPGLDPGTTPPGLGIKQEPSSLSCSSTPLATAPASTASSAAPWSDQDMMDESDSPEDLSEAMAAAGGGSASSSPNGTKSKRNRGSIRTPGRWRTTYQDYQTKALEMEFLTNRFIPKVRRFQLAKAISLTERQIKIWFQNRRMKAKKEVQKIAADKDFSDHTGTSLLEDIRFTLGGGGDGNQKTEDEEDDDDMEECPAPPPPPHGHAAPQAAPQAAPAAAEVQAQAQC